MKRLICMFRRNDIVIRIYLSFIVVLAVTVALIGIIFMRLYETNYMRSYTKTLSRQCSVIAGRVGKLAQKDRKARFSRYSADIDEYLENRAFLSFCASFPTRPAMTEHCLLNVFV